MCFYLAIWLQFGIINGVIIIIIIISMQKYADLKKLKQMIMSLDTFSTGIGNMQNSEKYAVRSMRVTGVWCRYVM